MESRIFNGAFLRPGKSYWGHRTTQWRPRLPHFSRFTYWQFLFQHIIVLSQHVVVWTQPASRYIQKPLPSLICSLRCQVCGEVLSGWISSSNPLGIECWRKAHLNSSSHCSVQLVIIVFPLPSPPLPSPPLPSPPLPSPPLPSPPLPSPLLPSPPLASPPLPSPPLPSLPPLHSPPFPPLPSLLPWGVNLCSHSLHLPSFVQLISIYQDHIWGVVRPPTSSPSLCRRSEMSRYCIICGTRFSHHLKN